MLTNANKKEQKEQKNSSYQVIVRNSAVVETKPLQNAKMLTNANKKDKKEQDHFYCASCNFTSSKKGNYIKHLRTMKHLRNRGSRNINNECPLCARTYKHRSSLSRHRQICEAKNAELKELLAATQKQNEQLSEIRDKLIASQSKVVNNTQNISINVFLNEHCKEAMNLTDFVDKICPTIENLLKTKELGYVGGISNILLENLRDIPTVKRPIHCSDHKRLQFYIKDNEEWAKDDEGNKIKKAIDDVTNKQINTLYEWQRENPNYLETPALLETWNALVHNIMGGVDDKQRQKNKQEIKKQVGQQTAIKEAIDELK